MPGRPGPQVLQGGAAPHVGGVRQVVGLLHDRARQEGSHLRPGLRGRRGHALPPGLPGEARGGGDDLVPGARVVHLLNVAAGHPVPVAGGQVRFEHHNPLGQLLRRRPQAGRQPGRLHHAGDVRDVVPAQVGLRLLAVVGLVGQAQPGLPHPGGVVIGVVEVVLDVDMDEAGESRGDPGPDRARQRLLVRRAQQRGQLRLQRGGPQGLDAPGVHEGGVERGDLAPRRRRRLAVGRRPGGELVENGAAGLLRGVAQHREGAGGGPVGGDLGAGQPGAVDVAEQVVLGADRLVDGGGLQDSGEDGGRGGGG